MNSLDLPSLDDALRDVEFMLPSGLSQELRAQLAVQVHRTMVIAASNARLTDAVRRVAEAIEDHRRS